MQLEKHVRLGIIMAEDSKHVELYKEPRTVLCPMMPDKRLTTRGWLLGRWRDTCIIYTRILIAGNVTICFTDITLVTIERRKNDDNIHVALYY